MHRKWYARDGAGDFPCESACRYWCGGAGLSSDAKLLLLLLYRGPVGSTRSLYGNILPIAIEEAPAGPRGSAESCLDALN